jgi:hypothetical protein
MFIVKLLNYTNIVFLNEHHRKYIFEAYYLKIINIIVTTYTPIIIV